MEYSIEEFDKTKTKIMKYVVFKKRTEKEVKLKFKNEIEDDLLEDIIKYIKENGYINDIHYMEKSFYEFKALNNFSKKEMKHRFINKGISINNVEDFFQKHLDELYEYELKSAKNIYNKKQNKFSKDDLSNYLRKKGYLEEIIKEVLE